MAVPDKEALASVRSEVDVHVSIICRMSPLESCAFPYKRPSPIQKSLRNHPNIVHFIEASATALPGGGYEIFILMEYCSGGGIIDLMNSRLRNRLTEPEVLKIFGDVAAGLSVMHHMDPPLMHRDLKVENILLAPPPRVSPSVGPTYKLCDFGSTTPILSRRAPKSLDEVKKLEADLNKHTTLQYRAPEMVDVYQRRIIDEKADVWAMGVLLYKLCYYTTPFEENGGGPLAILNARYRFPQMPAYSQRLKDLVASMLQEQSTSRPTIDQVITGIHRILGTTPPSSAVHYANLAASGKQMQPLPSVVSSSSSKPLSGSGADVAASAMAKLKPNELAGGVDRTLIEMGPSESERRRVEEEEFKKRNEGITPMRRGRPNKAANATAEPPRSPSPFKGSTPSSSAPSQPPKQQQTFGFADSFSPTTITSTGSAPAPPSRPGSGMHYSPSMPGMDISNRASPLPKAVSPLGQSNKPTSQDEEASSRFPSVEELDLQYGTGSSPRFASSRTPVTSPPASLPNSQSRASLIPGLSERAPVSAMAGKFGNKSSSASNGAITPPATTPAVTGKWTGAGPSSLAKRWPHQDSASSSGNSKTPNAAKEAPPPALPSRKPHLKDWLMDDDEKRSDSSKPSSPIPVSISPAPVPAAPTSSAATELDVEDAESSEEEDSRPEDVNEPVSVARKRQSLMGKSLFEERRDAARDRNSTWTKPSPAITSGSTGKVKKPDWLQQQKEVDEEASPRNRMSQPLQAEASNTSPSLMKSSHDEGAKDHGGATSAAAPAWDEDDEEMHFLPQPDLNSTQGYEQQVNRQAIAPISTSNRAKKYADAATSPGRGTPVAITPTTAAIQPTPTAPPALARTAAPIVPKDQKPTSFVSPKPIRSQSIKDVGGLVNKYQDFGLNKGEDSNSSTYASSSSMARSKDSDVTPAMPQESAREGGSRIQQRKDSLINGNRPNTITITNNMAAVAPFPPVTSSKPSSWSRREGDASRMSASAPKKSQTMKPWEREAAEKEQVERYGSLRSASPTKTEVERGEDGEQGGTEAQERFSGVSSLISQWQANSSKGAPGWGTVGGTSSIESPSVLGRVKSKEEEDLIKRSSTIGSLAGRRVMQSRLASRDV